MQVAIAAPILCLHGAVCAVLSVTTIYHWLRWFRSGGVRLSWNLLSEYRRFRSAMRLLRNRRVCAHSVNLFDCRMVDPDARMFGGVAGAADDFDLSAAGTLLRAAMLAYPCLL